MKIKRLKSPSDTFDIVFSESCAFDAVGFGINSVDSVHVVSEYPAFDTKTEILRSETLPGGQVATAMLFLAKSGCRVRYIGKVGGDDRGRFFRKCFESESIDISSMMIEKDAGNQYAVIIIDERCGERTILWRRDEKLNFKKSELDVESICSGRILHLDGYDSEAAIHAASLCREKGIAVSIDMDRVIPGCDRLVAKVDFMIAGSDFCSEYTGIPEKMEAFRYLSDSLDCFCVMTMGAEGAVVSLGGQCLAFPAMKVQAIDTTGAGDIFHGAFLFGIMRNWPLDRIMAFSNAASGLSCKYLGAQSGIRPVEEIIQCLNDSSLHTYHIV